MNILLTGGSYGIGAALVKSFRGRGDHVISASRSLVKIGDWYKCDFEKPGDPCILARQLHTYALKDSEGNRLDGVILNAGVQERTLSQWSIDQIEKHMRVNAFSQIALVEALEQLRVLNSNCRILFMGSQASKGSPWAPAYAMSKAAMQAYLDCKRLQSPNYTIVTIWAGRVNTPGNPKRELPKNDPNPYREPEEIVSLILQTFDETNYNEPIIDLGSVK